MITIHGWTPLPLTEFQKRAYDAGIREFDNVIHSQRSFKKFGIFASIYYHAMLIRHDYVEVIS